MKQITIWERYSKPDNEWYHNHIQDGWIGKNSSEDDRGLTPKGDKQQTADWSKGKWWHAHGYLMGSIVVELWEFDLVYN